MLPEHSGPICCHKLCSAEAVEPFDIVDARAANIFLKGDYDGRVRHYELCQRHFDDYFPKGHGWVDKTNATRLRVQCAEVN